MSRNIEVMPPRTYHIRREYHPFRKKWISLKKSSITALKWCKEK